MVFDGYWQYQNGGLCCGWNCVDFVLDYQYVVMVGGGQFGIQCVGGDGCIGCQFGEDFGLWIMGCDQCVGDC